MTHVYIDGQSLKLKSGQRVGELRLAELHGVCKRLKVPDIGGRASKDELIGALHSHLATLAARQLKPGDKLTYPLSAEALQRALETCEANA